MKLCNRLTIFALLSLLGVPVQAQLKDMPSQAELDPILENADTKLTNFLEVLTQFRAEAAALDRERLNADLKSIPPLRDIIRATHSGDGANQGLSMGRVILILSGLDDMAFDAAIWKSLAELQMCKVMMQKQDPSRYSLFGIRVNTNAQMLREVGGQLFHPTVRMADATDSIMLAIGDAAKKQN